MDDRDEFIKQNIGLVHACANRFRGRGMEYDDLYQAGCVGLIKAADNFDESRGLKFSTYAVPVILGEIRRLFREGGTVKVGRTLKELSMKANKAAEKFSVEKGRSPTIGELAEMLGVEPAQAAQAVNAGQIPLSLTAGDEEGGGQISIPVDAPEEKISEKLALEQVMQNLEERDRILIIRRYFQSKTQTETAKELGMTQVQVSRREKKILQSMRRALG